MRMNSHRKNQYFQERYLFHNRNYVKKSCWKFWVWDGNWTSEQARIEVHVYTLIVSPLEWHAFFREQGGEIYRERKWVSLLYPAPRLRVLILSFQFEVKKKNKFWKQANILPSLKLQVSLSVQLLPVQEVYLECNIRVTLNRVCPLVILKFFTHTSLRNLGKIIFIINRIQGRVGPTSQIVNKAVFEKRTIRFRIQ